MVFTPASHQEDSVASLQRLDIPQLVKMATVRYNDPTIIGYAVHNRIHRFQSIHAHTRGEDTQFYQYETNLHDVWQYMPVDSGEVVVEIWKHQDDLMGTGTCLMVLICPSSPSCHQQY